MSRLRGIKREEATRAEFLPLVQKGYAWMEHNHPDWRSRLDIRDLDMRYANLCVMAQLEPEGNFNKAAARRGYSGVRLQGLGLFRIKRPGYSLKYEYQILTELWQEMIVGMHLPPTVVYDHERTPELA